MKHEKRINRFKSWAEGQGGEVLPTTNEYELARIKHADGTFVIYQNAKGRISFSDSIARQAWDAFTKDKGFPLTLRYKRTKTEAMVERIKSRDGGNCFFCGAKFDAETPHTIEHLLSIAHGGNNKIANLVLLCEPCNREAGSMDLADKIRLRDRKKAGQGMPAEVTA